MAEDRNSDVKNRPRVMVVGSSNTDMVVKMEHLPLPGETVLGGEFLMVPGGKGANQAVAAARLGAQVSFVARVGTDVFGDEALRNFEHEGIDTEFIVRDPERPSGVALIYVDARGENAIAVAPGANSGLLPADIERASERMSECQVLVLQLEIPLDTMEASAQLGSRKGLKVILNPAPVGESGLSRNLLALVDVLVPNESETRALLGMAANEDIDEAAASRLLDLGVGSAIVTLGARGVLVVTRDGIESVPAPIVTAVDTTAAGDAFTGALAMGLASRRNLLESAHIACQSAAISVTRMGAQSSLAARDELPEYLERL